MVPSIFIAAAVVGVPAVSAGARVVQEVESAAGHARTEKQPRETDALLAETRVYLDKLKRDDEAFRKEYKEFMKRHGFDD